MIYRFFQQSDKCHTAGGLWGLVLGVVTTILYNVERFWSVVKIKLLKKQEIELFGTIEHKPRKPEVVGDRELVELQA